VFKVFLLAKQRRSPCLEANLVAIRRNLGTRTAVR